MRYFGGDPKSHSLGPAFDRTDFSRIFIFEPPDFFADFLAGFFLLIFVGKVPGKNPPGMENPREKILQNLYNKNPPTHFCQEWPRQTKPKKGQFMNFSQGHSGTKVRDVNRACFPKEKHQNSHKKGEIHELFVLALSLVWFAGATPDSADCPGQHFLV